MIHLHATRWYVVLPWSWQLYYESTVDAIVNKLDARFFKKEKSICLLFMFSSHHWLIICVCIFHLTSFLCYFVCFICAGEREIKARIKELVRLRKNGIKKLTGKMFTRSRTIVKCNINFLVAWSVRVDAYAISMYVCHMSMCTKLFFFQNHSARSE